ncbi:MAG: hypothetical protein PF637_00025 [Spirochaetes bacterium]|nr:hypothetical protein [Spirochaetota bacterium]
MKFNKHLTNRIILISLEILLGILYLANNLSGVVALLLAIAIVTVFITNANGFFPPYTFTRKKHKH